LIHLVEKSMFFPSPLEEVFAYHATIENIPRLMPDYLRIKILKAPSEILELGDKIHLRVILYALRINWEATITECDKNVRFTDVLTKGPFALWKHQHLFEDKNGGTLMTDRIEYKLCSGIFGLLTSNFFVRTELEDIFSSRHQKALQHLTVRE